MLVTARLKHTAEHECGKRRYLEMSKLEEMDEPKGKAEVQKRTGPRTAKSITERILTVPEAKSNSLLRLDSKHWCGQKFELTLDSPSPMDDRASSP